MSSFAEAPSPLFNNTPDVSLSLVKLYRVVIIVIPIIWFLSFICICCLCYYTIKKIINNNSTVQEEDIELGLSSSPAPAPQQQQLQMVIVNMPEDKEEQEAVSFKKVSWEDFKEAVKKNIESHDEDVMSSTRTSSDHECVICFEEFVDGDECRVRSKCNHIFHQNCISGWLSTHTTCPLCRGGVPGYVYRYVSTIDDQNPAIRV